MEGHPIPQDITSYQFRLIGEMTVKQFAYVAAGAVIAWVLFAVLPLPMIIKLAIVLPFAGAGAALAFVPVEGRPMDVMIGNFFKAVFSPTQYIYQKAGEAQESTQLQSADVLKTLYEGQFREFVKKFPKKKNKLDQKEEIFFQNLNFYSLMPKPGQTPATPPPEHMFADKNPLSQKPVDPLHPPKIIRQGENQPSVSDLKKTAELLERELSKVRQEEENVQKIDTGPYLETHQKVLELQKQLNELLSQKKELEARLVELQRSTAAKGPVYTPSFASQTPQVTKNVRVIPQGMAPSVGLPAVPEFPNVLTGIVKDPRQNPLSNILVEVKDEQGNAVRAFKTNALGRFASATPLVNGNYIIEFEDPTAINKFDTIAFKAEGQVIMPIEVISTDEREELRRTLFSQQN